MYVYKVQLYEKRYLEYLSIYSPGAGIVRGTFAHFIRCEIRYSVWALDNCPELIRCAPVLNGNMQKYAFEMVLKVTHVGRENEVSIVRFL